LRLVVLSVSFTMANPSLGDTRSTLHSVPTVATPGSALVPKPPSNLPSQTDSSAMAQFSLKLRELKAVRALKFKHDQSGF